MEHPSLLLKEGSDEQSDPQRPHSGRPGRDSFTPSMKRERPILRSSPLAGASFSADGAGNVVEHTSALEEELARRRTMLPGLSDDELAGLAASSPSSSVPTLSFSSSPNLSRKESLETTEEPRTPRRARPSFISLSPQGSRPGSRGSLAPPTPTSPTLRARHSSPHLAVITEPKLPDSGPGPANWMTAAPAPSFSRMGVRGSGVVMPVKASSWAGERIKLKSTPNQPARPVTQPTASTKPRSLKSFRSMSILRKKALVEHEREVPRMPTTVSPPSPQSSASSFQSTPTPSLASPITLSDAFNDKVHGQRSPIHAPSIAGSDSGPSLFSETTNQVGPEEKEGASRMRRLLSKVRKWRAQS
ncbi:unnamed protein product [Rhizoctonia solani]|uniref:Uncharacterized protein n=1 Tax=Rhizoctonia solani TaxID=456999 RepID=A0A8H3CZW3_9AGAM|nr:unnamed protein product [Rhizoctonia solani]